MKHEYLSKTTWSNLFFLIPFIVSIKYEILYYSLILGSTILISSVFHYSNSFKYRYPDVIISLILIISNFYLINAGSWKFPFSLIAIFIAIMAILIYYLQFKRDRVFYHNIWHMLSAAICYFSILTFLN